MNNNNTCKISVYKKCTSCGTGFCDYTWCGELFCEKCLDICWILDDENLCSILFTCCDFHRPQINFNNIKSYSHHTGTTNVNINDDDSCDDSSELDYAPDYIKGQHTLGKPMRISTNNRKIIEKSVNDYSESKNLQPHQPQSLVEHTVVNNNSFSKSPDNMTSTNSFIMSKSYEIKDEISNTFKKYIVDKIKKV